MGEFLGWATVVCSALAIGDFIFKRLNKVVTGYLPRESQFRDYYKLLLKLFIRFHKLFGLAAVTFAVIHFLSQYLGGDIAITGVIAVCSLALMGVTGIILAVVHELIFVHLSSLKAGRCRQPQKSAVHSAACQPVFDFLVVSRQKFKIDIRIILLKGLDHVPL